MCVCLIGVVDCFMIINPKLVIRSKVAAVSLDSISVRMSLYNSRSYVSRRSMSWVRF